MWPLSGDEYTPSHGEEDSGAATKAGTRYAAQEGVPLVLLNIFLQHRSLQTMLTCDSRIIQPTVRLWG